MFNSSNARAAVIVGNWKMHKTIPEARAFISGLALTGHKDTVQVGLAVPFTMILPAAEAARGSYISIGAQNVSAELEGPFTGEISCTMLKDAGASFVIVGHSERRRFYHEDNALVNNKAKLAIKTGLRTIVCIGESFEQRQSGKTKEVLKQQILSSLQDFTGEDFSQLVIAYEPIWAIGSNKIAAPEQAQEMHYYCRELVAQNWGAAIADHLVIQYGGSVKVENASLLLGQPDIDGLLIGGASLSLDEFSKIIQCQNILANG